MSRFCDVSVGSW